MTSPYDSDTGRDPDDSPSRHQYGRRVTLRQIADLAGVHPTTVSRALSPERSAMVAEETRAVVQETAEKLGYQPSIAARTLRDGRSSTVGVVVADLENPYTAKVIRGIENALEGRGIMALIAETKDEVDRMGRVVSHLFSRNVDAIITTAARKGTETILNKAALQVPVVLADRSLAGSDLGTIAPDDVLGGKLVAKHLFDLGHERVAELVGPSGVSSFERRSQGFRAYVEQAGGTQIDVGQVALAPTVSEGRRLMAILCARVELPTAVFAHNDLLAIGALEHLADLGLKCPDDMSVVGYDDLPLTNHLNPPLTTVRLPAYHLGRMAAEMAVALAEGAGEDTTVTIPPNLVVRKSTAAPSTFVSASTQHGQKGLNERE